MIPKKQVNYLERGRAKNGPPHKRQVYQGYDGFLEAVKQNPRNWENGGSLDFVFDKAYESLPAGFRNNLAAGMGWDLSFEKQLPLMNMLFGLKYDSDLNIDPQSSADVLAYVEDNSKITAQDLEDCGLTLPTCRPPWTS